MIASLAVILLAAIPASSPAPEMQQLRFFLGKWQCDGKQLATAAFGPAHAFKASLEARMESGGFWQAWVYEEKSSPEHSGFRVRGTWGWDSGQKRFVRAASDDRGTWDTGTALGLVGDKIIWTGDLTGPVGKLPFRHTFTKTSDRAFGHALELQGSDGRWTTLEEVSCIKRP